MGGTEKREEWAKKERPAREARKVFELFYGLYASIEREPESVELVLGDGILRWQVEGNEICHPLLLKRVQMEFDAKIPEFRIVEPMMGLSFTRRFLVRFLALRA